MALWARTDQTIPGAHGVSDFLIPFNLPGITRTGFNDLGTRPVGRGQVFFDEVEIPESCRIAEEGAGFSKIIVGFDLRRILIALHRLRLMKHGNTSRNERLSADHWPNFRVLPSR